MGDNGVQQDTMFDGLMDDDDHTVILKRGINLREMCAPGGSEFEIDEPSEAPEESTADYQKEDVYKYLSPDALGLNTEDSQTEESPFEILAKRMENLTEDGGIKKLILSQGVGDVVPHNVQVTVHYQSYLEYNDEPFDSTRMRTKPLTYILGCGEMIPGLEMGIVTMKRGEECQLLVSPLYAFGERGCPPRVPGRSTILYHVELVSWTDCTELHEFFQLSRENRKTCEFKLIKKVVGYYMDEGRTRFAQKKYRPAGSLFLKAIRIFEPYHSKDEEEENQWRRTMIKLYQNMALCEMHLCIFRKVISFCNDALQLDPNIAKALYLKGKALRKIGDFTRAKHNLLKADKLEPNNKDVIKELQELEKTMQKFSLTEKAMCQRMFAGATIKETKGSEEKQHSQPVTGTEEEVTDAFKKTVRERLQAFKNDSSLMEIPLPNHQYSVPELDFIEDIAAELELDHVEKKDELNAHIRLCKRKPEGSFD